MLDGIINTYTSVPHPQHVSVVDSKYGYLNRLDNYIGSVSKNAFVIMTLHNRTELMSVLTLINRLKDFVRRTNTKIGIFFQGYFDPYELLRLFWWCWHEGILDIFAATYPRDGITLNIFTYNPFATFRVVNVSASKSFNDFFIKQTVNFQQHPIQMHESREILIRQFNQKFWKVSGELMNATYVETSSEAESDISGELHSLSARNENDFNFMYPMGMESEVITVPKSLPHSDFSAYLQTTLSDELFRYSTVSRCGRNCINGDAILQTQKVFVAAIIGGRG